jgi:hypothetical protein
MNNNKKPYRIALLAIVLLPVVAAAQSPFDGTWKQDLSQSKVQMKPLVYLLQDGMYHCESCPAPFTIKADGQDQKVSGMAWLDTVSVKVVDDHTIEVIRKKDGRVTLTQKRTVTADGNSLTEETTDTTVAGVAPVTSKSTWKRVAKGPAGSHLFSGSWDATDMGSSSENGLLFTIKVAGDTMNWSNPSGQSYTAKLDGTPAPFVGDPGMDTISVKRLSASSVESTGYSKGKVVYRDKSTISADGKTITTNWENKLSDVTGQSIAQKQ